MKKKTLALVLILTLVMSNFNFAVSISSAKSEEVQGHVFLGGKYLEIGVNKYGYFGTKITGGTANTPAGFHPIATYGGDIGMQIDGDGWDIGNPPTTGDMFLPGSRYEGYVIAYKNASDAITRNIVMEGNYGSMNSSISTTDISSGGTLEARTIGSTSDSKVEMTQTTKFEEDSKMFTIEVSLENISSETLYDARYTRFVDPEPDYDKHSTFAGISSVTKNPPGSGTEALAFSKGPNTNEPFIYYANDSRARVTSENGNMTDPYSPNTYNVDGSVFLQDDVNGQGFLSMTFAFGDLAPGGKVTFKMYQSLDPNIDDALDDLDKVESKSIPSTITGSASLITSNSVKLDGSVGDDGGATISESGIVYSSIDTDPKLGDANVIKVSSTVTGSSSTITGSSATITGSSATVTGSAISISLSNLTSKTKYYFNVFATNSEGTGYSGVSSFTTLGLNDADLTSLSSTEGSLSPSFNSSVLSYSITVPYTTTSLKLTPLLSDTNASVKVGGVTVNSGSQSQDININSAITNVSVLVTAEDDVTTKNYEVTIIRKNRSKTTSTTTDETSSPPPKRVTVIVNGESQNFGTQENKVVNGVVTTRVLVDTKLVEDKVKQILESKDANSNEKNKFVVPISKNGASKTVSEISGNLIKTLSDNDFVIEISTGDVSYKLPSKELNIQKISDDLADGKKLDDVKIEIEIETPSDNDTIEFTRTLENDNVTLVVKPIRFEVKATYTSKTGEKTIVIDTFNEYVERLISIPKDVDPEKITTAVVINSDGSYSHIPTKIQLIDGLYYALVKSLTNSTYSVIWNQVEFSDMDKHWARNDVNDLASRLIITNVDYDKYAPDKFITRSEFVSMMVKGLGLLRLNQESTDFNDVYSNEWYSDAIAIALKYNIVSGYSENEFKPLNNITREEAFVIASKAMKLAGYTNTSYDKMNLEKFDDMSELSSWAQESASILVDGKIVTGYGGKLMPKEFITKAEAAVLVKKILSNMELID